METTIFRNTQELGTEEVLNLFEKQLKNYDLFQQSEIEQLVEAYAKNPSDRFIISEKLEGEASQGDILIFSEGTEMYKNIESSLKDLKDRERLILQEGDSMTGDHRLVMLHGTKYSLKEGIFGINFLTGRPIFRTPEYKAVTLETDRPFLIYHREHGNIALPSGKYIFCSQLDSYTLSRMAD